MYDHMVRLEYRPFRRGPMTPGELAEMDQVSATEDLEAVGTFLLSIGFEFRVQFEDGEGILHVRPAEAAA